MSYGIYICEANRRRKAKERVKTMSNEKYWVKHEQTRELLDIKAKCLNGPVKVSKVPYFGELLKYVDGIDNVYFYCCPYDKSEDIYMGYKEDLETRFKDDVKRLGINNELGIIKQKH